MGDSTSEACLKEAVVSPHHGEQVSGDSGQGLERGVGGGPPSLKGPELGSVLL